MAGVASSKRVADILFVKAHFIYHELGTLAFARSIINFINESHFYHRL